MYRVRCIPHNSLTPLARSLFLSDSHLNLRLSLALSTPLYLSLTLSHSLSLSPSLPLSLSLSQGTPLTPPAPPSQQRSDKRRQIATA